MTTHLLDLRDVCVDIEGTRILDSVDLTVSKGEVIALLGPNGAGKTTLLRAALGIIPIAHGSIELLGGRPGEQRPGSVALVPQRLPGASGVPVSVDEVVRAGVLRREPVWDWGRSASRAARAALAAVDLADRGHYSLETLSGGQQRRVMIARALAGNAELFFLDEPMAGVDTAQQDKVAAVISQLREAGKGVVVVTHELDALHRVVTGVVELVGGASPSVCYAGPLEGSSRVTQHRHAELHEHDHYGPHDPHHGHDDPPIPERAPLLNELGSES
jgi:zinc transport system ATP-binding protein